jgi:lysozyme
MKVYIATGIGKQAYADSNLQNADFNTVSKMYNDLKTNGSPALQNKAQYGGQRDYASEELSAASNLIQKEEGFRSQAYQDQTGKWTIGFGTTMINGRPVQPGDVLSREQSTSVMQSQILNNYTNFADVVTVDMTPNQFAALTSFEYNLGGGVWNSTTGRQIIAAINSRRFSEAGQLMKQYNKSKNPQTGTLALNPGLASRREREAALLLT